MNSRTNTVVIAALLLTGCGVEGWELKVVAEKCAIYGGVERLDVIPGRTVATCRDGNLVLATRPK